MRITELLDKNSIFLNASPQNKEEALDEAVRLMSKSGKISDMEAYRYKVGAREEESTTGIGEGIAIPHGKCEAVISPGLAAMVIPNGVDFDSLDGEPVTLLFLIAAPDTKDNIHLDVLGKLSMLLMDEEFTNQLRCAESVDEFINIIDRADEEKAGIDERLEVKEENTSKSKFKILAVTSCPTGIAHTYMAAQALENAAKVQNCDIKIETRGSGGAKNVFTTEEIKAADCIIVAADTQVPVTRFSGKKVIQCQVSDGISRAEELIMRAKKGDAAVYNAKEEGSQTQENLNGTGTVHDIYTQLMNGVSYMLPFVVGGGILIAIAFLIDGLFVDVGSLSAEQRADFGTITSLAAMFKQIGTAAFGFMLPVLAGYIAMAIGDRPALAVGFVGGMIAADGKSGFLGAIAAGFAAGYLILGLKKICTKLPETIERLTPVLIYPVAGILIIGLFMNFVAEPVMGGINTGLNNALMQMNGTSKIVLGFVLAGMMAIDMGGPFNKAAYVFGTASVVSGSYDIMAAVMIGGMVPPCAIALSTMIFPEKFTKQEREAGPANFIMGLAFITEGAIPYAAADPLRVIPASVVGAGTAGAMAMAFNCTLMAPHGGIFVVPVIGNAWLYLVSLAVGVVISAVLLGILKKQ